MSALLTVGRIDIDEIEAVALSLAKAISPLPKDWLGRMKRSKIPWLNCEPNVESFYCLNVASITFFLEHVCQLEGIRMEERLSSRSIWPNLPDYMETYWLPLEFSQPQVFTSPSPFMIGSAHSLMQELRDIKTRSPFSLGTRPEGFNTYTEGQLSEQATCQWIWLALYEGALKAIELKVPLNIGM